MSSTDVAPLTQPTRQQLAAEGRTAPGKVTGKLKRAIDLMVWEGLKRAEAAASAGLTDQALYAAFRRPYVKAHYASMLEVLRTSAKARNIHALEEVRDQTDNAMARVNAVKALEQLEDVQHGNSGSMRSAGIVIVVGSQPVQVQAIEHKANAHFDPE